MANNTQQNPVFKLDLADAKEIIRTGNAFHLVSQNIVDRWIKLKEQDRLAAFWNHELVVAATNMSFSIELIFKAIYLAETEDYRKGHVLIDLFNALPEKVKEYLRDKFKEIKKEGFGHYPHLYRHSVIQRQQSDYDPSDENLDIEAVLTEHGDAFVAWRYQFDSLAGKSLNADFGMLEVVFESASAYIQEHLWEKLKFNEE